MFFRTPGDRFFPVQVTYIIPADKEEASPNTICLELALLSHLFTIAVKKWGMGGLANPVQFARLPKNRPEGTEGSNPAN